MKNSPIYLSPPSVGASEEQGLFKVLRSGWVAPAGPAITAFEKGLCEAGSYKYVTALSSGTAALHLAVKLAGVEQGDLVVVGTFTFVAAANAVTYQGGIPIFVDSESRTWNIDPGLLERRLALAKRSNERIKAVIVTHLYGMPAQMDRIVAICDRYDVILIENTAEALGGRLGVRWLGGFGRFGVLSFNGNKIITTSGGGALICQNSYDADRAIHLSQQAKEASDSYHHTELGYNYRLSNVLAALGVSQLDKLNQFIERKREIYAFYKAHLEGLGIFDFLEEPTSCFSNRWLTTLLISDQYKELITPNQIIDVLKEDRIEARRLWKPLHLQPLYHQSEYVGGQTAERLFNAGICLPSGVDLTQEDLLRVIAIIKSFCTSRGFLE